MPEENGHVLQEMARMSEQIKTLFNQQAETKRLTESVHDLASAVKLLASAQKNTEKKLDSLSEDVEAIKARPARQWEGAIATAVTAVVTAVITYALTRLGMR